MLSQFPFLSRMIMSATVTVGVLGLAEWGLTDRDWSALYDGDPGSMWWLKADLDLPAVPHLEEGATFAVRTNELGLRDGLMPVASPWVLTLGCSTTFGWGVEAEQAWPAVLERELGVPVVNGGIPGHSTEQGMKMVSKLFAAGPDVAILGWGLRDAQRTTVADVDRTMPRFPRNTALYTMLRRKLQPPVVSKGTIPRVSEVRFEQNLRTIVEMAKSEGIEVLLLDMTGRSDNPGHGAVLARIGPPVVVPQLSNEMVFTQDPIHLNARGNTALARLLVPGVSALLAQEAAELSD